MVCVGQPGYEDLEHGRQRKTNYPPFYASKGEVMGYQKNKVQLDARSELGPLRHSCWTYWGHSGALIVNTAGAVVGMHNSWNPKNAMRHGMSALSLQKFRQDCKEKGHDF